MRERYASAARRAADPAAAGGCCGGDGESCGAGLYAGGCGNPTAMIDLHAGETVLDLGSGGGIDVLVSRGGSAPPGRSTGST